MSPTGSQDFNEQPTASPTANLGETPSRILMGGGSNSQAGRWLWASGFESGMQEFITTSTTLLTIVNDWVFQGKNSCKVTTNAVINDEQAVYKILFPQGKRFGLECYVSNSLTLGANREISLTIYGPSKTTGTRSIGKIIFKITAIGAATLQTDVNGVRTTIATINDYAADSAAFFHYIKFVFDLYENKFIRLYFDDLVYDLGGVPGFAQVITSRECGFIMRLKTMTAAVATSYIDNVVLTADEP
jgi:hypothetical protein